MLCRLRALDTALDRDLVALLDCLRLYVVLLSDRALLRPLNLNRIAFLGHRAVLRLRDRGGFLHPTLDRKGVSVDGEDLELLRANLNGRPWCEAPRIGDGYGRCVRSHISGERGDPRR